VAKEDVVHADPEVVEKGMGCSGRKNSTRGRAFAPERPVYNLDLPAVRILCVTTSFPKFEGDTTAPFIESITRELASRGHDLTVVLPARSDLKPVPIDRVRFRPYRYAPSRALEVFGYAEALRADVALRWAAYAALPLAVLSGLRSLRKELRDRAYDVVHAHWVVPSGAMAALALASSGPPLVVSLHGSDVFLSEKSGPARLGANKAFRRAAAVTACSRDLADRSIPLGARSTPEVIPYGVASDLFRPDPAGGLELRRALALAPDAFVLFAAGRLVRKKGFEYLLEAAGELSRRRRAVELVIAGKGDLEHELAQRARALGLSSRLKLAGDVSRSTLPRYFAMADAVVVPSVRDSAGNVDGLPNVLLEAMASGKAIVATNVAGIPEALRAGEDGLLVPEKDPAGIADAVVALMQSDELRGRLGRAARRRVEEDMSWKKAGERFESVLRSVAEARRP
jgi:glycosyltransferase involved in cell wall biosynthesis